MFDTLCESFIPFFTCDSGLMNPVHSHKVKEAIFCLAQPFEVLVATSKLLISNIVHVSVEESHLVLFEIFLT